MDATARDHGVNHQAGRDQTIINNTYYGPPPPGGPGKNRQRTVWTVAAAVGGAALLAVVLSNLPGGGGGGTGGTTTGGPTGDSTTASASPSPSPSRSSAPPSPDPKPAAGSVRWKGTLRLDNEDPDHEKDLDEKRPTMVDKSDKAADLWYWNDEDGQLESDHGAVISEWTDHGLPSAEDCADTAEAAGGEEVSLKEGKVYCVKTNGGHYARLKVTKFWYDIADGGATFDTVIWNDA